MEELIEEGDYFSEEQIKQRDPLMYHMYVGRFQRNADVLGNALIMSDFIFQRMDEDTYKENLKEHYQKYLDKTGRSYFAGQIDQAYETNSDGEPIELNAQELEDNEDELIRLMHDKFINGEDKEYFDYSSVDYNEKYDDEKQLLQDEEDKWFEQDQGVTENTQKTDSDPQSSVYTGILDY
eukprot:403365050